MSPPFKKRASAIRTGILSFVLGSAFTFLVLHHYSNPRLSDIGYIDLSVPSSLMSDAHYPIRKVWRPSDGTHMNVSHFIYRDLDRDGVYATGDRPMVGVAVRLTRPDGSQVIRRSNIHGFVNFTNSLTASPVDVSHAGDYEFEVLVPDGWMTTSDNLVQTARYTIKPGSRPGIISNHVPEPTGLVQKLTISGSVVNQNYEPVGSRVEVIAIPENGDHIIQVTDRNGNFAFEANPGLWRIEVGNVELGNSVVRDANVRNAPVRLSAMVLGDDRPHDYSEPQYTIDFETITLSQITKMPNGPAGLSWQNLIVTENEYYRGEGYINNTMSGRYVGYNTSGYPVVIRHPDGFNFHGGYFGVAWARAEGETLHIRAWREDELVGSESYTLSALGPFWFDADYRNITRLELETEHYWQFVTDDLVFSKNK